MTTFNLPAVEIWTVDDLAELPAGLRYELHNGKLVIMSPARVWHEEIARRICNHLHSTGRFAATNVGVLRTRGDTRVPDVAVFRAEPDPDRAWHDAGGFSLVVEVWSPSSDGKDHEAMHWYAERGIDEYWLAEPLEGDRWGAFITCYAVARASSGEATYLKVETTTLHALEHPTP